MPNFMIAYHGGNEPKSKEDGAVHMEKWKNWVKSLGDAVVNPGTPLPVSKIVTLSGIKDDSDPNAMKGFAIVRAENTDAAIKIAQTDPFLSMGGTIRISQMMEMK